MESIWTFLYHGLYLVREGGKTSILKCYADLIKIYPSSQGINPYGEVIQAKIESSTAKNIQLEECVINQIKTIKFSKNKEGAEVGVKYPFVFQPTPS